MLNKNVNRFINLTLKSASRTKNLLSQSNPPGAESERKARSEFLREAQDLGTCNFLFFKNSIELSKLWEGLTSWRITGSTILVNTDKSNKLDILK